MSDVLFPKGHEFHGPRGQGYRLTADVRGRDMIRERLFEAFGGAPTMVRGDMLPKWLDDQLKGSK